MRPIYSAWVCGSLEPLGFLLSIRPVSSGELLRLSSSRRGHNYLPFSSPAVSTHRANSVQIARRKRADLADRSRRAWRRSSAEFSQIEQRASVSDRGQNSHISSLQVKGSRAAKCGAVGRSVSACHADAPSSSTVLRAQCQASALVAHSVMPTVLPLSVCQTSATIRPRSSLLTFAV